MFRISKLFHNYIKFNFHVGLAVLALVQITILDFDLPFHFSHQFIFFLAPFLAYNFVKFHRFLWKEIDSIIKLLLFLIGFSAFGIFLFEGLGFYLPVSSWIILFFTLLLVLLYCLPLPGFRLNFRGFKGLKIHLVALSWVLPTVFLPLSIYGLGMAEFSLAYAFQRYIFVIVATLPFEIRDMQLDDPKLSTWPQILGIKTTRWLGSLLLFLFVCLELHHSISSNFFLVLGIAILLMGFVLKSEAEQSKYFSRFWVEGIPILWLFLKYIIN